MALSSLSIAQTQANDPGEDRFSIRITPSIQAFAVFDGHGGYLACDLATTFLLDMIITDMEADDSDLLTNHRIAEIIDTNFSKCDDRIVQEALQLHRKMHSTTTSTGTKISSPVGKHVGRAGTCVVVVIITRGMIFTAHAGDCRAVLIRDDEQSSDESSSSLETSPQAIPSLCTSSSSSRPFSSLHNQHQRYDNNSNDTILTNSINNPEKTSPESISSSSLSGQVLRRHTHRNVSNTDNQIEPLHNTKCDPSVYSLSTILPHQSNHPLAQSSSTFTIYDKFQNEWENNKRKCLSSAENSSQSSSQASSSSSSLPSQSMKTYSKRTMRKSVPAPQPTDFTATYRGLKAQGITLDHGNPNPFLNNTTSSDSDPTSRTRYYTSSNPSHSASCDVPKEVEGIRTLSNDPNPVRQSDNDRKHLGIRAPLRVAGSLAVARALGDSYLKVAELSTPLYALHVPYITGRPTISYRPLRSTDRAVVLASDGLWNFISANDCAQVLYDHLQTTRNEATTTTTTTAATVTATAALQDNGMDIDKENHSVHGGVDVLPNTLSSSSLLYRGDVLGKRSRGGDEVLHSLPLSKGDEGEGQCPTRNAKSKIAAHAPGLVPGQGQAQGPTGISRVYWGGDGCVESPSSYWFTLDSHTASVPLNPYTGFDPTITATANVSLICRHSLSLCTSQVPNQVPSQLLTKDDSRGGTDEYPVMILADKYSCADSHGGNNSSSGGDDDGDGASVLTAAAGMVQLSVFNCSSSTLSSSRPIDNRGVVVVDGKKGTEKRRMAEKTTELVRGVVTTCGHVIACRENVIQLQAKVACVTRPSLATADSKTLLPQPSSSSSSSSSLPISPPPSKNELSSVFSKHSLSQRPLPPPPPLPPHPLATSSITSTAIGTSFAGSFVYEYNPLRGTPHHCDKTTIKPTTPILTMPMLDPTTHRGPGDASQSSYHNSQMTLTEEDSQTSTLVPSEQQSQSQSQSQHQSQPSPPRAQPQLPQPQCVTMKVSVNDENTPAAALMNRCLDHAAKNYTNHTSGRPSQKDRASQTVTIGTTTSTSSHIMTGSDLKTLPQGTARRCLVDDITVIVITFQ